MQNERWLLPEGIDEILPPRAWELEQLRRDLLDLFHSWGYEFVIPPFVEFLESLLTGTGGDLDLQTFKLTDQVSGRLMGVRADIAPQAARIDAHRLREDTPSRLCYLGTVLHTRSDGFAGSRSPLQIGAELYGHGGVESDLEILRLMIQTLDLVGVRGVSLDLGHVGIFRSLAGQAGLDSSQESALFDALQRKAVPEIEELVAAWRLTPEQALMFEALAELNGDDALAQAGERLLAAGDDVHQALAYLRRVADGLREWMPEVPVHFDLAELRGYHFHTGTVFAAFVPDIGKEIARGGRYDGIGRAFGRARPATGFSADLKILMQAGSAGERDRDPAPKILAPWSEEPSLQHRVMELRGQGMRVIPALPGQHGAAREMGCDHELRWINGKWQLTPV